MVSKEIVPHLHSTRIRMNHNVVHWLNKIHATFSHTWKTFSCTNWLQGYCKRLQASRQLHRLEYLKHILWSPESEKKLQTRHKLDFQFILQRTSTKLKYKIQWLIKVVFISQKNLIIWNEYHGMLQSMSLHKTCSFSKIGTYVLESQLK